MSTVFTLQEVIENEALGPSARAFCEALLKQGEVLAVELSYLPDTMLWLVKTAFQKSPNDPTPPNAGRLTLRAASAPATIPGATPPALAVQVPGGVSAS